MFEGFTAERIELAESSIFVRHGGTGPAVLLLHGHPRTSSTWYLVAPRLIAAGFTVICPDLRGYGQSQGPQPAADHSSHSKRASASDMAAVMSALGHDHFAVAGHDRGGPVAFRLTLDAPERITHLAALDCIPISDHLRRCGARFAAAYWHWFFFARPRTPERVINADPDRWYTGDPGEMGSENYDEFRQATRNPDVVRGMLEDYRAGLTIDRAAEEADRARGTRITCPVLVLWSLRDDLEELHGDPRLIWREWAEQVDGHGIDSGHHMAEQAPGELASALASFLAAGSHPASS
jgi:haloacetate dehalogenase